VRLGPPARDYNEKQLFPAIRASRVSPIEAMRG
jgi:hypothetical protein